MAFQAWHPGGALPSRSRAPYAGQYSKTGDPVCASHVVTSNTPSGTHASHMPDLGREVAATRKEALRMA
jgi:hypothetical protein